MEHSHGNTGFDEILRRTADRLRGSLRDVDTVARLQGARFAVVLHPTPRPDLESMIQLAARLQSAAEVPLSISLRTVHVSAHVGFCLISRSPERSGTAMLQAAETAADEARRNGPSAIRAFSAELQKGAAARGALAQGVSAALEGGQIVAHFEPQLSTDTGEVSGFEAVPRWLHPERGLLAEAEVLTAIDAEGQRPRLGEVMLYHALTALRGWDKAGVPATVVSLPISPELLANPKLAERFRWELDRFEIAPQRLRLVLEPAVMTRLDQDMVAHNLSTCAQIGVRIELAGFGTGPASVSSLRRTGADRLRIDRSFVARVDTDPDQRRLVVAVLAMAQGIGLDTLADGAALIGEHAMLAQLGCGHVQGPAISRPMAFEDSIDWLQRHRTKLDSTPRLGQGQKR